MYNSYRALCTREERKRERGGSAETAPCFPVASCLRVPSRVLISRHDEAVAACVVRGVVNHSLSFRREPEKLPYPYHIRFRQNPRSSRRRELRLDRNGARAVRSGSGEILAAAISEYICKEGEGGEEGGSGMFFDVGVFRESLFNRVTERARAETFACICIANAREYAYNYAICARRSRQRRLLLTLAYICMCVRANLPSRYSPSKAPAKFALLGFVLACIYIGIYSALPSRSVCRETNCWVSRARYLLREDVCPCVINQCVINGTAFS